MLKPHAGLCSACLDNLDYILQIAAGLINLQPPLIKQ